jgi:LacI family transcriptional regulator
MTVTQKDVANKLGISQRSVAFALSESPQAQKQVSPETRSRILRAVEELGYRPHRHAQLMRTGKSGLIGMIQSRSLFESIVERSRYAAREINAAGFRCLSMDLSWGNDELPGVCDAMIDARVEGVVLAGPDSEYSFESLKRIQDAGIPMVGLGSQRFPGIPHAMADVRQGMRDLTRHLIGLGHREMALVVPELAAPVDEFRHSGFIQREAGFTDAVTQAGLTQTRIVRQPVSPSHKNLYEPGRLAAMRLMTGPRPPRVILCSDDYWALGAFKACADLGLRVPQDVAITGFNDSSIAEYTSAALTTVAQPIEECAQKAVELLMALVRPPHTLPKSNSFALPCRLVVRQSCGAGLNPSKTQAPRGKQ